MKRRLLRILPVLVLLLALLVVPAAAEDDFTLSSASAGSDLLDISIYGTQDYDEIQGVFQNVNKYREEVGAAPLTLDPTLVDCAMQRAAELALYYSHTRPDGTSCITIMDDAGYGWGTAGENIAIGYGNADAVSNGWYTSPGHYRNMVNTAFRSIGIGCFYQDDGTRCWVQMFSSYSTSQTENRKGTVKVSNVPISILQSNADFYLNITNDCGIVELYEGQSRDMKLVMGNSQWSYCSKTRINNAYSFTSQNSAIAACSGKTLTAVSAGETTLQLTVDKMKASIPVKIHPKPVLTYTLDGNMPVLTWDDPTGELELFYKAKKSELWSWPYLEENGTFTHRYVWDGDTYDYVLRVWTPDGYVNVSDIVTIQIGHSGKTVIQDAREATCTQDGYTGDVHCWDCGEKLTSGEVIPKLGHSYTDEWDASCNTCGEIRSVPPMAPVIRVSGISSTGKNKISWDAVSGAVKYQVYRATSKNGTYSPMITTTKTSYTNTSAKAGTRYYYYVVAVADDGTESAKSNIVSRTCDLAKPVITTENVASSGKIKVSWNKVEGAKEYKVYRATSKNGTYKLVKTTTSTSYTNTSAEAGKAYYYKVKAIHSNEEANSAYSEIKSRTCDLARPVVSIKLSSKGKPSLSWKKIDGAKEYKIYRATSKSGKYSLLKTTTSTSFTNTGAAKGKTYYYKVVAVHSKSAANSAYSLVDSIKSK